MIHRKVVIGIALEFFSLLMVGNASAEAEQEITGSIRGAHYSSSRNIEGIGGVSTGSVWTKYQGRSANMGSFTAEAVGMGLESENMQRGQLLVREAYLDLSFGDFDFRLGKQIIAWGRGDKLNPTDNLTPHDYTLQVAEDEEQRYGANSLVIRYQSYGSDIGVVGVWQPRISPNIGPMERKSNVVVSEIVPNSNQLALKLDSSGGLADWSISCLDGVSLNPEITVSDISGNQIDILLQHNRVRTLGGDVAAVVGQYGLRGEFAYTWTHWEKTQGASYTTKPFLYFVFGGDRNFDGGLNVNVQYFHYQVSNYVDPRSIASPVFRSVAIENAVVSNQLEPRRYGMSTRVGKSWMNDTLEGEVAMVLAFGSLDYVVKSRVKYAISDQMKISVGGDIFRGDPATFFGRLRDTSTIFTELKYSY